MRIFRLMALGLFLYSFSYAYPDISIGLESTKSIMPDVYKLGIDIIYQANTSDDVIRYLGKVDKIVRGLHLPYHGGNFRVFQNCFYSNNRYICEGYKGIDSYSFYLKSPENQEKILNALKNINYQVVYSGFVVPEDKIKTIKEQLIKDLAQKSIVYASNFSKIYHANCFVKSISYMENVPRPIMFSPAMVKAPLPRASKEEISMRASVDISCK